jgi:hypothetical protein
LSTISSTNPLVQFCSLPPLRLSRIRGSEVKLVRLMAAQYNGIEGTLGAYVPSSKRFQVALPGGSTKMFLPENLVLCDESDYDDSDWE